MPLLGEISYDLVMEEDMSFIEGTFRVDGGDWQVIIANKEPIPEITCTPTEWESGVCGVVVRVPEQIVLNANVVERILSEWFHVDMWKQVRGPDSMALR